MSIVTNTAVTYSLKGAREDLSNLISNISPVDTVFSRMAGAAVVENTLAEWQTDALAPADTTNAQLEGDDVSVFQATTATVRVGNRTQISYKTVVVSGTADVVNKAGRKSELAYQITKKTKELKRDIEAILTRNQASNAGGATTPRQTGTLAAWVATNSSRGTGGASGGFNQTTGIVAAATDGTQRPFTEAMLKSVILQCYQQGGEPDTLMVGPFNKQVVSSFTGNATRTIEADEKTLLAAVEVYRSDFGDLKIVPNRFQRERDAFVLQSDLWKIGYLRPMFAQPLATTGDAKKQQIITEYALMSMNEAGSGVIADLTTQ